MVKLDLNSRYCSYVIFRTAKTLSSLNLTFLKITEIESSF